MSIKQYRPKVGEILEYNYGVFAQKLDFNGHIPPEMIKLIGANSLLDKPK